MNHEKKVGFGGQSTMRCFLTTFGLLAMACGLLIIAVQPVSAAKNSVIVGMTQEPVNFNPLLYVNSGTEEVPEACMFDALWDINEKGEFVPNLAVKVPTLENGGISQDGMVWEIELKKGIKWHDGAPFTAKDVEFTYQTIINPKVAIRSRSGFDLISEFKIIDDYNVEIHLSKPFVPFAWAWQKMHIVPAHILSKESDINTAPFNTQPIGTGPYKLVKRVAGSHMVYKRNMDYHRGAPAIETVIHKFVPDQTVAYTQFKTGEIDVFGLHGVPPVRFEEARKLPGKDALETPAPWVEFIYFNCGKPQFQEKAVRQALYYAVDKEKWIKDIYYGLPPRTLSYLHPNHWAYNQNLKDPGYSLEKAAAMLEAAGWKKGADGIREKNGVKLKFSMSTTAGSKAREQAQAMIQANWKEIGVAMEIKNMPASVVWGEYTTKSQFDTLMVGWEPTVGMDPDYTARCHSKQIPAKYGTGSNYVQYENPELDKLLEEGVLISDMEKRKAVYQKIQEILHEDVPFAPIFAYMFMYGKNSALKGYQINPYVTDITWNIQDWSWE
ncbi:MAG: peptide ABC transporter substrate-binding protein [Desulfobacteraceae bacterium]|nr:peptide ABC transporter substrate-binding protein [Desulfobacteraceae bacterium]